MNRVLVTGGAGFIGSHLVERLLARGDLVRVVDSFDPFYDPRAKRDNTRGFGNQVEIVESDIRDADAMERVFRQFKPDIVAHLAARAGVRPSLAQPRLYAEVNVTGTINLLELTRRYGARKFVFASSSSIYGVNQKTPFAEADPVTKPISPYAATKLAGEHLCQVYHHLYGIEMVVLRLFTVYGPRQRPDLAIHKFSRAIERGDPITVYGNGSTCRDYTHIDDVMRGILAGMDRTFDCEVFNLGGSRPVTLMALISLIESALGKKAILCHQPDQPGDVPVTCADLSKSEQMLDYHPLYSMEKGIGEFVRWFRQRQLL